MTHTRGSSKSHSPARKVSRISKDYCRYCCARRMTKPKSSRPAGECAMVTEGKLCSRGLRRQLRAIIWNSFPMCWQCGVVMQKLPDAVFTFAHRELQRQSHPVEPSLGDSHEAKQSNPRPAGEGGRSSEARHAGAVSSLERIILASQRQQQACIMLVQQDSRM